MKGPSVPTSIDYARANHARAGELRSQLRKLDEAADGRPFTAAEQSRVDDLTGEIRTAEAAVGGLLDQAARGDQMGDNRLAGLADGLEGRSERDIRNLPRVAFTGDQLRELHAGLQEGRAVSVTAETRAVTAAPPSLIPTYVTPPISFAREPTRVASFIPTQVVEHASVVYYKTTTAASAAATVAEGAAKPESTPGWTAVTAPVRKIAHWVQVSSEALADYANFQQVVQDEMTAGLILQENAQILSGDGTGTNLTGLTVTSGILAYAPGAAEQRLLSILHGITLLRSGSSFTEADRIMLNPSDWEIVLKSADTTGELMVSPVPTSTTPMSLWGVPVTVTSQVTAGTGIVANLAAGAVVFSREPARLFIDPYGLSTSNMVRILAEERLALGVTRPSAIVKITFNGSA